MDLCDSHQHPHPDMLIAYLIPSDDRMSGIIGGGADKLPLFPV